MEILATITKVFDKVEGTSSKGSYCIQPLLVEFEESTSRVDGSSITNRHSMIVNFTGLAAKNANFAEGQVIRFQPLFHCHEYQGRHYQKVQTKFIQPV